MEEFKPFKIYFFSLDGKLPRWYPALSRAFSDYGVNVVPVEVRDLSTVIEDEKSHIIFSETGFYGKKIFQKGLKGYLGFSIRNTSNFFHHISSFAMDKDKLNLKQKNKTYFYYRMPFTPDVFASHVSSFFYETQEEKYKWPGGKRARLPNG